MRPLSGPTILALGVLLGAAVPPLAEAIRPLLTATVFVFVAGTFLRTDLALLRRAMSSVRTGVLLPRHRGHRYASRRRRGPERTRRSRRDHSGDRPCPGLPAVERQRGDGAHVRHDGEALLAIILLTMLAAPATMPLVGAAVGVAIDPWTLASGLALLLFGTGGTAIALRAVVPRQVERLGPVIDRTVVIALFAFAIATMDGVVDRPGAFAGLLATAFGVNVASQFVGAALARGGCPGPHRARPDLRQSERRTALGCPGLDPRAAGDAVLRADAAADLRPAMDREGRPRGADRRQGNL